MSTYNIMQWEHNPTDHRHMKWFVVSNDSNNMRKYLRADGTWQDVMACSWLTNGGTWFNTQNEAQVALASTGFTDNTNSRKNRG